VSIQKQANWVEIKADSGFKPQAYGRIRKDLKPESNTDMGPKDYFEIGSNTCLLKAAICGWTLIKGPIR
jgi:hypothetical protein